MSDYLNILADLRAAIHGLIDPMEVTDPRGHTGTVGSVLAQVQDGRPPVSDDSFFSGGFRGTPPMWLSGLDWLTAIENPVRELAKHSWLDIPHTPDLETLLRWAAGAPWPESAGYRLVRLTLKLNGLREAGLRLVYPELFTLDASCPDCRASHVTTGERDGQAIRRPALVVRELFAECGACGAEWWGADIVSRLAAGINAADTEDAELLAA